MKTCVNDINNLHNTYMYAYILVYQSSLINKASISITKSISNFY